MPSRGVALITGGSGGIGLAVAGELRRRGYDLTLAARDGERLRRAVGEIEALVPMDGGRVEGAIADVSREEDVTRLVADHRSAHGSLDVLVHAAGMAAASRLRRLSRERVEAALATNLVSGMLILRESEALLRDAGERHGRALVVALSSAAVREGAPFVGAYSASKAGLAAFLASAHTELRGAGVRLTTVTPSLVATEMTAGFADHVPRERMVQPGDVARAVGFLLDLSPACHVAELELGLLDNHELR